jgi:hypothetical protein
MHQVNQSLELVLGGWVDAIRRRDLDTIERHLHPDVVWRGLRPELVCSDRAEVLTNVRRGRGAIPHVDGIELLADHNRVLLGVRGPDFTERFGVPLEGAIYTVFTVRENLIVTIEAFAERETALAALHQPDPHTAQPPDRDLPAMPPTGRVDGLVPFVHVADVERSIAFYELLGFEVSATHGPTGRVGWAALDSEQAQLMLERTSDPIDSAKQGVLFYLYSHDLHSLREHLIAHGARPSAIVDGRPGPDQELRIDDPDGYCLVIAQREQGEQDA